MPRRLQSSSSTPQQSPSPSQSPLQQQQQRAGSGSSPASAATSEVPRDAPSNFVVARSGLHPLPMVPVFVARVPVTACLHGPSVQYHQQQQMSTSAAPVLAVSAGGAGSHTLSSAPTLPTSLFLLSSDSSAPLPSSGGGECACYSVYTAPSVPQAATLRHYELLGRLAAKALRDGRASALDLPLSAPFLTAVRNAALVCVGAEAQIPEYLVGRVVNGGGSSVGSGPTADILSCAVGYGEGEGAAACLSAVSAVSPAIGKTLRYLHGLLRRRDALLAAVIAQSTPLSYAGGGGNQTSRSETSSVTPISPVASAAEQLVQLAEDVSNLCLDFTVPGLPASSLTLLPYTKRIGGYIQPQQQLAASSDRADTGTDITAAAARAIVKVSISTHATPWYLAFCEALTVIAAEDFVTSNSLTGIDVAVSANTHSSTTTPSIGSGCTISGPTTATSSGSGFSFPTPPHGSSVDVTLSNLHVYVVSLVDTLVGSGIHLPVTAFLRGFSAMAPGGAGVLPLFTPLELGALLGGGGAATADAQWTPAVIAASIVTTHGYSPTSPQVRR